MSNPHYTYKFRSASTAQVSLDESPPQWALMNTRTVNNFVDTDATLALGIPVESNPNPSLRRDYRWLSPVLEPSDIGDCAFGSCYPESLRNPKV